MTAKPSYELFDRNTEAIVYGYQQKAIQRMLDFDFACRRDKPSVVAIVNPTGSGMHQAFWGSETVIIPVYKSLQEAVENHDGADVLINYASRRSAYNVTIEALNYPSIKTISIIAEGIPEHRTKVIVAKAKLQSKTIIGPASVGGIKAGAFKIGDAGGTLENIVDAKLHRAGHISYITRSGGMANELNNIISRNTDGVYEGIALGGDRFPGTSFIDHFLRYEANPAVKIMVMLGEVGGTDEYEVVKALKNGSITKPVISLCIGTSSDKFATNVQFGHAGAKANTDIETAQAKNKALREAGAIVPESFNDLDQVIRETYKSLIAKAEIDPTKEVEPPKIPIDYEQAVSEGLIRKKPKFTSTIVDERGPELKYYGVPISEIIEEEYGLGGVLGLLWFKTKLPEWAAQFLEIVVLITADHGPAVSGAHNTIVTTRAGKDLVSSLVSGLLTIGPRFGGAVQGAADYFSKYLYEEHSPEYMVKDMKAINKNIQGIGHLIKSINNPDMRVKIMKDYAFKNFPVTETLNYALEVEKITTAKRDNLILNVDGCIGALCCDMLRGISYTPQQVRDFVNLGGLNALFVLGRTVGLLGHILDQKRLAQGLYRHPYDDILYMPPEDL